MVGTKVAITAQLNCHQHLMEALDQAVTENKYLQILSEAWIRSRLALFVADHFNYRPFFVIKHLNHSCKRCVGCAKDLLWQWSHICIYVT